MENNNKKVTLFFKVRENLKLYSNFALKIWPKPMANWPLFSRAARENFGKLLREQGGKK